jgi:hypothetical protein
MNRSTFILGFTLLIIAVTLAVFITLRNAPDLGRHPFAANPQPPQRPALAAATVTLKNAEPMSPRVLTPSKPDVFSVILSEPWIATLPTEQQSTWRIRAAKVEKSARARLDRLTTELELSAAQRAKMFSALVRSAPGYDPVMIVAGGLTRSEPVLAATEEIHQILEPQQQVLLEDQEVDRQLWWQDTLARLEADLIASTGGVSTTPAVTTIPAIIPIIPTEDRVAPDNAETGNLFDLLKSNP